MGGGINDLENMSTETSQTESKIAKKKKNHLYKGIPYANCRKPKMKRKILKGNRGKKHLND